MFGLCDCNNFFASCERVFNPSLNGKPIVVLSNNDGCVIARSNEAKALGIKMGQPVYQLKDIISRGDVKLFSSNYNLYGDMSNRVFQTIKQYAPTVEIYSIDEAFIDLSGMDIEALNDFGRQLVRVVRRNTGIPISIGIAPTKTLAKVASKLCKQYPKLEGCCVMHRPEDITKVLKKFPIGDIWGIGRRYNKMLNTFGVEYAEQFRALSPSWIKDKMSIVGVRTWRELHGEPVIEFEEEASGRKSIMVSRSFAKELTTIPDLEESLTTFISIAARKLRAQQSLAGQMQVFIFTNRHRNDKPQHIEGSLITFPSPTDSTIDMVKEGVRVLKELYREGYEYKKAGVVLYDISSKSASLYDMFEDEKRTKHKSLMATLDNLSSRYGRSAVMIGHQSSDGIKSNRNHLSPEYTTKWGDILTVKV